jgi:gluconate 2-dehydrogenase gamma chain
MPDDEMPDDKTDITRRQAIKTITVGAGVVASLPVLGSKGRAATLGTEDEHMHHHAAASTAAQDNTPYKLKFFTEAENRTVIEMSERIIPADEHSPGAKEARVSEYIDTVLNESPKSIQQAWRSGIAAVDAKSRGMFDKSFADATVEQQIQLLTELSKRELGPQTEEEKFFRTIKSSTIDGYYTSKIGIHDELHYKGNTYLKEFVGCTHPEHQT